MEIVVGMSGASGVQYGIRLMQVLRDKGCIIHLVISSSAARIIEIETDLSHEDVLKLADHVYEPGDFAASIASGSNLFKAMVIIPCSMGTLSAVACGSSDTLISRTADVCLKEKRQLIMVPRETPLSLVQLRNMCAAAEAGAVILPACPAFYTRPESLDDLVDVLVGRVLDLIGVEHDLCRRWKADTCRPAKKGNAYNRLNQSDAKVN